jgi:hypothetical protein
MIFTSLHSLVRQQYWLPYDNCCYGKHSFVSYCLFVNANATFNAISAMLWRSVLLVEETGVPRENYRPAAG